MIFIVYVFQHMEIQEIPIKESRNFHDFQNSSINSRSFFMRTIIPALWLDSIMGFWQNYL
jgi:hypothetical protein